MPGESERDEAADRLDHLAEHFAVNHDPEGEMSAHALAKDVRDTPQLTGEEADGIVNDARAGNWEHADQVLQNAKERDNEPHPHGPEPGGHGHDDFVSPPGGLELPSKHKQHKRKKH